MKIKYLALLLLFAGNINAQNISAEMVDFQVLQQPKEAIDAASRNFKVTVTSPYNLTADDVIKKAKTDYQDALKNYDKTVADSQTEFQQKLKDYDTDTQKAKEKYETEQADFKKLTLIERLTMTDQGKNPKLVLPTKPVYVKPSQPVYRDPNLNDYTIVDNNVLASKININGFTRGKGYVDVYIDIKPVNFQDNTGQSYANQPTKLVVKVNGAEKINTMFFEEYEFISSAPTNNINKPLEEKNHLNKVIAFLNDYLNGQFGFGVANKSVKIQSVKNKGQYDDLARADIYVKTNLRKLQPENADVNAVAMAGMQKGIDIWTQTLDKVDYKNNKADLNAKIAEFVYFNLIRLNLALGNKKEAESWLNKMQDNLIYMKLSYDDQTEMKRIEQEVYKK